MKRFIPAGRWWGAVLVICFCLFSSSPVSSFQEQPQDNPIINYQTAARVDPVTRLQQRMDRGEVKLEFIEPGGYLQSVLKLLNVPVSSQGLVFSKTSFQLHRISPTNPRAIYFGDDVYVGWVRGGDVLEVSAVDPNLGGVFYLLEQTKTAQPRFRRNDECLQCHVSNNTRSVPGHFVRSVYPDARGYPIAQFGTRVISHSNSLRERWGGWYVTGTHGADRHPGNQWFDEKDNFDKLDLSPGANLTSLKNKTDLNGYATTHSDLIALMVLEHQTQMHNRLTRLNYETRIALNQQEAINKALNRPASEMSDGTRRRIQNAADEVLRYLLFTDEAKLQAPIKGTSEFASEFASIGPKDKQGRSLREFDLQRRMFRYPCSYVIYSAAFDALPDTAREYLYRRLWQVLSSAATEREFAALSNADRRTILEILRDTKKTLPAYFYQ